MPIGTPRTSSRAFFVWRERIASGGMHEALRQVEVLWCSFTMMSKPTSSQYTHSSR